MRKERFPIASRRIIDRLVCLGNKVFEPTEGLEPHVLVKTIRNALGMTQAQLAKRAGMTQSHLAKIESGKVDVQLSTLRKIFRGLFCEVVVLPRFQKSPRAAVAERVKEVARRKIGQVTGTMELQKRRPDSRMIRALIRSEEERLLSVPSSQIWEDPRPTLNPDGASIVRDRPQMGLERAPMPLRIIAKEGEHDDLNFWLEKSPAERIAAVEFLREQYYALSGYKSLPRLAHVVQLRNPEK